MGAESTTPAARPGDRLKIPARTWNALTGLLGEKQGGGLSFLQDTETRILVRNDTGDGLESYSVVKVGDAVILPTVNESGYESKRIFAGESPVADEVFAVTQQPIPADGYGWALILGVTTCTLNVASSGDTHAGPGTSTSDLDTGTSGPAVILWKETGTGAGKKAKVLLTGQAGGGGGGTVQYVISSAGSNPSLVTNTWVFSNAAVTLDPGDYMVAARVTASITGTAGWPFDVYGGIYVYSGTASIYQYQPGGTGVSGPGGESVTDFYVGGGTEALSLKVSGTAIYRVLVTATAAIRLGALMSGVPASGALVSNYTVLDAYKIG